MKIGVFGLAALFLVNFAYMADYVIVPAINSIYEEFSEAPSWILNFVTTGTQLTAFISALFAGTYMKHFSKKSIIIFFFGLFTVAASLGCAIENIYYIALMRAIAGFAMGALPPVALALINEVYHDDTKKCDWLVGSFNAAMALIGAVMSLVAGFLCAIHWQWVYYEYLAAIPMLLLMVFYIPKTPPEKEEKTSAVREQVPFPMLPLIRLLISLTVFGILYITISYQCSIYIAETGMGGSGTAGTVASVMIIGSTLGGLIFAPLYQRIKRKTIALLYLLLAAGYLGICFVFGSVWFGFCCMLFGFAYGTALPFYYQYITVVVPPERISGSLGFVTAAIGLGSFASVYVTGWFMNIMGLTEQIQAAPYFAAISLVLAVISLIRDKKSMEKQETTP